MKKRFFGFMLFMVVCVGCMSVVNAHNSFHGFAVENDEVKRLVFEIKKYVRDSSIDGDDSYRMEVPSHVESIEGIVGDNLPNKFIAKCIFIAPGSSMTSSDTEKQFENFNLVIIHGRPTGTYHCIPFDETVTEFPSEFRDIRKLSVIQTKDALYIVEDIIEIE